MVWVHVPNVQLKLFKINPRMVTAWPNWDLLTWSANQDAVWSGCFWTSLRPPKRKRSCSIRDKMVACLFGQSGHVTSIPLGDSHTVIVDWYMHNYCLLKVFEVRCQHRPKTEFCGLHDNASVQTAATIVDCSQQEQSAAVATLTTPLSL